MVWHLNWKRNIRVIAGVRNYTENGKKFQMVLSLTPLWKQKYLE